MKPHPRIRKTVKWGGLALTLVVSTLCLVTGWIGFGWYGPGKVGRYGLDVHFGRGVIGLGRWMPWLDPTQEPDGFRSWRFDHWSLAWWWEPPMEPYQWGGVFPLWPVIVLAGGATLVAWRLDTLARRRVDVTHCPRCR